MDFLRKRCLCAVESRLFGRVAKNPGFGRETFLQTKIAGSIDTFCVSMIKYIEINHSSKKGDNTMQAKSMRAKRNNQFAAGFVVESLFPFLLN